MARFSAAAGHMKVEENDVVSVFGVKGKVTQVMVIRSTVANDVLLSVIFKGAATPNVFNLSEIEAIRHNGAWVNLHGETVTV
jgi:hypothetical protein